MANFRAPDAVALSQRVQTEFGRRLQTVRKNATSGKVQQDALAEALGVSRTTVSNIERGRHRVFLDQVYAAAKAMNVSITELLPSIEDVFPGHSVLTPPDASVTPESAKEIAELVRWIQQRAAREAQPRGDFMDTEQKGD